MIAFGLGRLRLAPDAFWALSPRELARLIGPAPAPAMDRGALAALMRAFPDEETRDDADR